MIKTKRPGIYRRVTESPTGISRIVRDNTSSVMDEYPNLILATHLFSIAMKGQRRRSRL